MERHAQGIYPENLGVQIILAADSPKLAWQLAKLGVNLSRGATKLLLKRKGIIQTTKGYADEAIDTVEKTIIVKECEAPRDAAEALTHRNSIYEVVGEARISGTTRAAHRASANRALLDAIDSDPRFARQLGEILGVDDVAAHMRSGRSGLRNPPGTEWHHPINNPEVMQLLRREVHRHPELRNILHPGPNNSGGFGQNFGG